MDYLDFYHFNCMKHFSLIRNNKQIFFSARSTFQPEEVQQTKRPIQEIVKEPKKDLVITVDSTSKEPNNEEVLPSFYSTHYCTSNKGKEAKVGVFLRAESVNWSGISSVYS